MPWNYQSNYVYKYKGSLDDFKISFFKAIQNFNRDYPDNSFQIVGNIDENKVRIELGENNKNEVYFYSPIQLVNGEIRIEGILKTIVKRPFIISLLLFLFNIILFPLLFLLWMFKKVFGRSSKMLSYQKLAKIMLNYIGCEPCLLIETENQIKELKDYISNNTKFTGKLEIISSSNLIIKFNEYLELDITFENQYDEAYVSMNDGLTHWHPMNKEVLDEIKDIVEGNTFFIEHRHFSILPTLTIITDEMKLKKYLGKKDIRIYNNQIIQRSIC